MQIDFKIVSYHRLSPEQISEFSVKDSATFGRANVCDWCLPDPEKVISSSHVKIEKAEDKFYLYDTSTNGVFINRSVEPIGKGHKYLLCPDDLIAIGDYEITVSLVNAQSKASDDIKSLPNSDKSLESNAKVHEPVEFLAQDILSSEKVSSAPIVNNDLNDAFISSKAKNASAIPEDWDFGLSEKPEELPKASSKDKNKPEVSKVIEEPANNVVDTFEQTPLAIPLEIDIEKLEEVQPNVATLKIEPVATSNHIPEKNTETFHEESFVKNESQVQKQSNVTNSNELDMFIKGLGISNKLSSKPMSSEIYFELGQSMNLMFMGLIKLLRNRSELKSEFKINQTTFKQQENNPLKFSATIDDVFNNLYLHGSSSFLSSEKAIQDVFKDTEKHDKAFSAGTLGALLGMLEQLDPNKIEEHNIQPHLLDKLVPAKKEARNWALYNQLHSDIKSEISSQGSGALTDDFVKAYDKKIRNL